MHSIPATALVDDNLPGRQFLVTRYIERLGQRALQALRDLMIPVLNGFEPLTACKHTPGGGAEAVARDPDTVEVTVRDNGLGISAVEQGRIFGPFIPSAAKRARRQLRAGFGLNIIHYLSELQGGAIWLTNIPGEKRAFTLCVVPAVPHGPRATATAPTARAS